MKCINSYSENIMSRNTHCQELHNEHQSHVHVILRNLGNQLGKTPMWGNPKRDILLTSKKLYQQEDCIYNQEKTTYNTQTAPPKIYLKNHAKFVLLYDPPRKQDLKICSLNMLYALICTAPFCSKECSKQHRFLYPQQT
jgi:hypothetical protein